METYLKIFGSVVSVLAFVAYYHPTVYRRFVDPLVATVTVLTCAALLCFQSAVVYVQRFVSSQDLIGASPAVSKQYREIVRQIGELQPPFEWYLLAVCIFVCSMILGYLQHMGITRDSRDSAS